MEEKDSDNFCTNCGSPLRDSDTFCTKCGSVKGSTPQSLNQHHGGNRSKSGNKLTTVAILSILWAVFALGFGLFMILGADYIVEMSKDLLSMYNLTEEGLRGSLMLEGSMIAASGGLAMVTAILCLTKRLYIIAIITCILSAVLGLTALIGIVGFIVAYLIYKAKNEFVDNKTI